MNDPVLSIEELARLLGKTPKTVRYDLCRHPERLPMSFTVPGTRKRLFLSSAVQHFFYKHAAAQGALPGDGK
jgi:hypothetical protein